MTIPWVVSFGCQVLAERKTLHDAFKETLQNLLHLTSELCTLQAEGKLSQNYVACGSASTNFPYTVAMVKPRKISLPPGLCIHTLALHFN